MIGTVPNHQGDLKSIVEGNNQDGGDPKWQLDSGDASQRTRAHALGDAE